jgi:diguanylate cyclase (GGDEF)-like protein
MTQFFLIFSRLFRQWLGIWIMLPVGFGVCLNTNAETLENTEAYPKKMHFRNIMQNQDIALGEVEAIIQDYEGFMWLGGRNALLRYDGYEFLNIPVVNSDNTGETASASQVVDLFEDSHHNLWVASRTGLFLYDRSREVLHQLRNKQGNILFRDAVYSLEESSDGQLLVGTSTGLLIVDRNNLEQQTLFPGKTIYEILIFRDAVWIGITEGMIHIDWASKKHSLIVPNPANPESVADNTIWGLAVDPDQNIWAGSDNGVYRLDSATGTIKHYKHDPNDIHSIAEKISRKVFVDKKGRLWSASDGGGISLYDQPNDRFIRFSHQGGSTGHLSSNSVRSIYEDKIGDLWVGTYPSGVNVYDQSTAAITAYKKSAFLDQGLLDNNVEAIEEDREGNIWLGAGGISYLNRKTETFSHYQYNIGKDSRADSGSILNGVVDSDGEIRFGSWAHGIQLYDKEKDRFNEIPADPTQVKRGQKTGTKLNDQMVWSVYEDRQKNIWITTHFNGLTKFDKKTGIYTFYPHDNTDPTTISSALAWTSFEDSQGRFWVGTAYGLNLMNREKGTFKQYLPNTDNPNGLADGSVLSMAEDSAGRVWFGTDAGLHLYHPATDNFTVYGNKNGFVDQGIRAIVPDQSGNLWLGTNNGIVMFNPDTQLVKNYTRHNGELIGGITTGSGIAMRTGEIAFGSRNGLFIFDTAKLLINETAPPVVFTDFRIFTQKVAIGGPDKILTTAINQTNQITLDYTQSMISFSFAALNYRDSEKNQYAYMLEGFDDKWREVGNQRSALYTNLPAGKYSFHVKASNNDGVWNPSGRSIKLIIMPPPWKTWWAYSLYCLVVVALLLYFAYTQHKKVLDERKTSHELELKVAERTAELQIKNGELENAYAQLEAISLSDPLTGLNNRRYLQKLIPMDIAKVQREYNHKIFNRPEKKPSLDLTFFILDVDYFKSVNDVYGHNAGDQLLIQLSDLLTKICRESDCVVRWGGEEFLIVSRFADRDEAPLMSERIRKSIERHDFELPNGGTLKKTCSIGFACYPFLRDQPLALSWEQVIDIADRALYAAKKTGRNRSIGLVANKITDGDVLYQRICSDLQIMIENDELAVIAPESNKVIWD